MTYSKLGPFMNVRTGFFDEMAYAGVRIVKGVANLDGLLALAPRLPADAVFIYKGWEARARDGSNRITDRPEDWGWDAAYWARSVLPTLRHIPQNLRKRFFVNITNEYSNWANLRRMAEFEAACARLIAQEGFRAAGGSFAVGTPEIVGMGDLWLEVYPLLEALSETGGVLSLHEYFAWLPWNYYGNFQDADVRAGRITPQTMTRWPDTYTDGWHLCRYRQVWRKHIEGRFDVPIVIGEFGAGAGLATAVDAWFGAATSPAWKDAQAGWSRVLGVDPLQFYIDCCLWYDMQIQRDPYLLGAVLYTLPDDLDSSPWDASGIGARLYGEIALHNAEIETRQVLAQLGLGPRTPLIKGG